MHSVPFFLVAVFGQILTLEPNNYWRDYTGDIPVDAVIGGKDINDNNVYIGQAYVKDEGLIVVQIAAGVKEVAASINGVKKINDYIKILCGPQANFVWLPANASDLHLVLLGRDPVIGGHEDELDEIYIGRTRGTGGTKIGKIHPFKIGYADMFFVDKDSEKKVSNYEVLLYEDNTIDK